MRKKSGVTSKRQLAIASKLKARRQELGLSINELARQANVAKSNLSRMEAGEGNPSLETVWALSDALNINVSALIETTAQSNRVRHSNQPFDVEASDSDFGVTVLSTCPPGATRDIYKSSIAHGRARMADAHQYGTIEHVIVLSGCVSIGPTGAAVSMEAGDYMSFRADTPHLYEAGEDGAEVVIVMEYPN
ncbi:MAG: XRE family transcriptional regulator [Pseudomonadota bacterium]